MQQVTVECFAAMFALKWTISMQTYRQSIHDRRVPLYTQRLASDFSYNRATMSLLTAPNPNGYAYFTRWHPLQVIEGTILSGMEVVSLISVYNSLMD